MSRKLRDKTQELTERFQELTAVQFVFIIPSWAKPREGVKYPDNRVFIFGGSKEAKATIMKAAVKSVREMDKAEEELLKDRAKHQAKMKRVVKVNEVQAMRSEDRRVVLADENDCPHGVTKSRCEACTPRTGRSAIKGVDADLLRDVDLDII